MTTENDTAVPPVCCRQGGDRKPLSDCQNAERERDFKLRVACAGKPNAAGDRRPGVRSGMARPETPFKAAGSHNGGRVLLLAASAVNARAGGFLGGFKRFLCMIYISLGRRKESEYAAKLVAV